LGKLKSEMFECSAEGSLLDAKLAFLGCPESYDCRPATVEVIETHMAWVFLTNLFAYKLKKPVQYEFLDFSTLAARKLDCQLELNLNRRLAPDVYLAVVPLTQDCQGTLRIDGRGTAIDWLVKMRKLPRDRMLDRAIRNGAATPEDVQRVGRLLSKFYCEAPRVAMSTAEYCTRLIGSIGQTRTQLLEPSFGLPRQIIESIASSLLRFVDQHALQFEERLRAGCMLDAHGDLRPEHICLERPPVIIDCLEFSRDFRLLDPASELSFLTLECDLLGATAISRLLWKTYIEQTGDAVPHELRRFHRSYHALIRARIAIRHLKDALVRTPEAWKPKAERYLRLAAEAIGC
jgi:aminoglycoside phosphotransferase family enzyme